MSTMIRQQLLAYPLWTQITVDSIAQILLVGPAGGYEVAIAALNPDVDDSGIPIIDGKFEWSAFDANEDVWARPFGRLQNEQPFVTGISAAPPAP